MVSGWVVDWFGWFGVWVGGGVVVVGWSAGVGWAWVWGGSGPVFEGILLGVPEDQVPSTFGCGSKIGTQNGLPW